MGNPNRTVSMIECLLARGQNNFLRRRKRFEFPQSLGQEWPNTNRSLGSRRGCRWMGRNVPKAVIGATTFVPTRSVLRAVEPDLRYYTQGAYIASVDRSRNPAEEAELH
jgi:hypothetical protein